MGANTHRNYRNAVIAAELTLIVLYQHATPGYTNSRVRDGMLFSPLYQSTTTVKTLWGALKRAAVTHHFVN